MEAVFLKLFNLSLKAAWLILAVLVLRLVLTRAPKNVRCIMWGLVGLRLILPFSIESALSLLPSREVISMDTVRYDPTPTLHTGVRALDNAVNPAFSRSFAPAPAASVNPLHVLTFVAGWVWLIGMAVMVLYFLISAAALRRRVSGAVEVENRVWESDLVPSPFVFGLIDPRAYLPTGMDPESKKYVVAHELAHIRRRDYLFKPLAFLVLAVYWFNPLVWVAYVLLCRDIELACDEYVLTELGAGCKRAYSEALLSAVTFHRHVAACPVAFGEGKLKERVKNVLRWKKPVLWLTVVSVLLCAVLAVGFLTDPKDAAKELAGRYVLTTQVDRDMGGDFWIELREDGTMEYSEGYASSVLGEGVWKLEKNRVTVTESGEGGRTFIFDVKPGALVYDAGNSDRFTYIQLLDGALFERDTGGAKAEAEDITGVNADTDFVSNTPMGWRLNVSVNGSAAVYDDSASDTRGQEVWRGQGFDPYVMWNDFNGNYALLRQSGKYKALDISSGVLYDIELQNDPEAVLTPHNSFWEGPFWLLLDVDDGELALYTVGDEWACASSESAFYSSLFERSLQHDAATSEELARVYGEIFDRDTERFLLELGVQDEDVQEQAALILVYGKAAGDFEAFAAAIKGHPAVSSPAGLALVHIENVIDDYTANALVDSFVMTEDHTRWAQTFKNDSGLLQVTVYDNFGHEQTVPAPEGYGGVSCEPRCWIGKNTLLLEGVTPDGAVIFLFDARSGVSKALPGEEFYGILLSDGWDGDFYRSYRAQYYPHFIEADAKAFLHGLLTADFVEENLDIAAQGAAADGDLADRLDALLQSLQDDPEVGELAQTLSGKINSLMAERTSSMTPPAYEGTPQRQEPFTYAPDIPAKALGLTAMPDWAPSQPLSAGSTLPELTGSQFAGFDALPDLSGLHEWKIDLGGDAWWDGASLEERAARAARTLWGDSVTVSDTGRGFVYASPVVDGFREEIRTGGADGSSLSIGYSARNDYTETAPYYTGNPVTAGESVAAARAMAAVFGMESLTAAEPSLLLADGEEHTVGWALSLDGAVFERCAIISYVVDGRVTDFSVTLPCVTPVTDGAPRWFLTPKQALHCVNYARSLAHLSAVEGDDDYQSELIKASAPVSVALCWSGFFTNDSDELTPAYYFSFESAEYRKEGVLWRDTCTAVVDAYTGKVRMTSGWEEWDSPYATQ